MTTNGFSARTRRANIQKLNTEQFDILVVGGGITGAGIARDAALRGYRVALVDKGDFASGTSSKSSKLVHGGVRYMELFEFGLVAEASRERRILWNIAPHLVRPLPFVFPVYRDARWPKWMIDIGMWMYDGLAMFRNFKRHQMLSTHQVEEMIRGIDTRQINGAAYYYDAQVDDARLTLETIRAAHRHGAIAANYVQVDGLRKANGRVTGTIAHDVFSGEKISVRARVVVNATGPWSDTLLQLDDPTASHRMRPTKGIHIVVPRGRVGGNSAATFPAPDGRLMFLIPWGAFTIIGTTESDYADDFDRVCAEARDVDYVLRATNYAFPKANLQKSDIISAYAGLRPLVTEEGKDVHATSREHQIWASESGLVTIAGGKLTTYREMARQLVDLVEKSLRAEFDIAPQAKCLTARIPLVEYDNGAKGAMDSGFFREDTLAHLESAHGIEKARVLELGVHEPSFAKPIVDELPYVWAEVKYALENEMALTLADVLERRTHIFWEARDNGVGIAPQVAEMMAGFSGWDRVQKEKELRVYQAQVNLANRFR